jgi:hypothetical protein
VRRRAVIAGTAIVLLVGCSAPRWSSPHRFPVDTGRPFLDVAPAGWGTFWVAEGMVASLHGPPFEQVVAGSISLSALQLQAIAGAATPELAAVEVRNAMAEGGAWWWLPGSLPSPRNWPSLDYPFSVTVARAGSLDGRPGLAFDGLFASTSPVPPWPAYRIRVRAAVVGDRLHFVALGGARRLYFDAAVPVFDEVTARYRVDAGSGSR